MRSLAAFLEQEGYIAHIQPMQGVTKEQILERIQSDRPRLVGFSLIFQRMLGLFADLIAFLREEGVTAHFTMGGHFPTFAYEEILSSTPGLDTVVRYEGEETLLELVRGVDAPDSWADILGLAYRTDGHVKSNPPRPLIGNLDDLPFPVRRSQSKATRGVDFRSISASRGCYYNCSFCSINAFYRDPPGPARRARSPENVVREMAALRARFDTRVFIFQDDDIYTQGSEPRRWLDDFLAELDASRMGKEILWRISCRVDDLDSEYLKRMSDAGLATTYVGIESASDSELKAMNKGYSAGAVYEAVDRLHQLGIPHEFGFMLFTPDSSFETVRENIQFLRHVAAQGDALVHFCKMSPYAGTAVQARLRQESRLTGSLSHPDYRLLDPKLDLLQLYYSQAFNFRNFDDSGLVERLRFAKFDALLLSKLDESSYDAARYAAAISDLIRECNESALDAMAFALEFIERNPADKVRRHWAILEQAAKQEFSTEQRIAGRLDRLMTEYGYRAS